MSDDKVREAAAARAAMLEYPDGSMASPVALACHRIGFAKAWQASREAERCETCKYRKAGGWGRDVCINELGPLSYTDVPPGFGCILHEEKE